MRQKLSDEERKTRRRESSRKWRAANQEKKREQDRRYRDANRERRRENERKRYADHADEARLRARQRYAANPAKRLERAQEWAATNPDRKAASVHKHRALKAGNGGSYTAEEWQALCAQCNNQCIGPGPHSDDLEADHVVPILLGGTSNIENIQPLCKSCNCRKGTKTIDYRKR